MANWKDEWLLKQLSNFDLSEEARYSILNWARFARERGPVVLVGAGMSLNAAVRSRYRELGYIGDGEPRALSWSGLTARFKKELRHQGELDESDPLWLAQLYEQTFGKEALLRVIEEAVPDRFLQPGAAHKAIFEINWQAILTTNYDKLIERAHESAQAPGRIQICITDADLVRSAAHGGATELIHLHGVIDQPETIVLTLEDYRQYATRSPGLLTKVRQLFLQHPVLLLGVGATDPNFIQWSGWIRDLVGSQQNPWISLAVGKQPSQSRRLYWQGALQFIPTQSKHIPEILGTLGRYLNESSSTLSADGATEWLKQCRSISEITQSLADLLSIYEDIPGQGSSYRRSQTMTEALKQALLLRYGDREEKLRWDQLRITPQDYLPITGNDTNLRTPTREDQRQLIRDALGPDWAWWIACAAELLGGSFYLVEQIQFDVRHELSLLADDSAAAAKGKIQTSLEKRTTLRETYQDDEDYIDIGEQDWHLNESDWRHNLKQTLSLRTGRPLQAEQETSSAQDLRRSAFVNAMEGDAQRAADLYGLAAESSRDTNEPEWVEWLTLRSAIRAASRSSSAKTDLQRLEKRTALLERRNDSIDHLRELEVWARDELAFRSVNLRRKTKYASRLFNIFERLWLDPWVSGPAAENHGHSEWIVGELKDAIHSLTRYGSRILPQLLRDFPRSDWREEYSELLLTPGRWPSEWIARAEALFLVVPNLTCTQSKVLGNWIAQAVNNIPPDKGMIVRPFETDYPDFKPIAQTLIHRWAYLSADEFVGEWSVWLSRTDAAGAQFKKTLIEEMHIMPLGPWQESDEIQPHQLDFVLGSALESTLSEADNWRNRFITSNRIIDIAIRAIIAPKNAVPAEGRTGIALKTWLDNQGGVSIKEPWLEIAGWIAITGKNSTTTQKQVARALSRVESNPARYENSAIHALAEAAELLTPSERTRLLSTLRRLLEPVGSIESSPDPDRIFDAVAHLAVRLIETAPTGTEEIDQLSEMARTAAQHSLWGVYRLTTIPMRLVKWHDTSLGDFILRHLSVEFDSRDAAKASLVAAACASFILVNPGMPIPHDWAAPLIVMSGSSNAMVAKAAFRIIRKAVVASALPQDTTRWDIVFITSVCRRTMSDDGDIRGAAAAALLAIVRAGKVPAEKSGDVSACLRRAYRFNTISTHFIPKNTLLPSGEIVSD